MEAEKQTRLQAINEEYLIKKKELSIQEQGSLISYI